MEVPVRVTFRGIPVSDEIERICLEEAEKLERYHDRITSCHVVVALPHHHHKKGNLFHVRVDVLVPGSEVVVNREPPEHKHDEKLALAIREAFDTARRRIEDVARRQRHEIKSHVAPPRGRVAHLHVRDGFGFIATSDGREVYFHRNSVLEGAFDDLEAGSEVEFHEEQGAQGPQASSVRRIGRRSRST